jgi:hypothetical protein
MYAAIATRPDIAYAINMLSQFNVKLSQTHWNAVKHVPHYLESTKSLGITYDMDSGFADLMLATFSDSDNGKSFHKKAISGGVILLASGVNGSPKNSQLSPSQPWKPNMWLLIQ